MLRRNTMRRDTRSSWKLLITSKPRAFPIGGISMRAFSLYRAKNRAEDGSRRSRDEIITSSEVGKLDPDVKVQAPQRLKPDKWKAAFDAEGKLVGFSKVLKSIVSGGVDNSIRCEVWEFLLGCYGIGTTCDYREEIRLERRKRYKELIEQCRMMHVSVGTGNLAYTVGSKILDARITSRQTSTEASRSLLDEQASSINSAVNQSPAAFSFSSSQSPTTNQENDPSFFSDLSGAETDSNEVCEVQRQPLKSLLQTDCGDSSSKYSPGRIGPNSPNILHFKFFQQASSAAANRESGNSSTRIWTNNARHENFRRLKAIESAPANFRFPAGMPSPNPVALQSSATDERIAEWLWTLHKIGEAKTFWLTL